MVLFLKQVLSYEAENNLLSLTKVPRVLPEQEKKSDYINLQAHISPML